MPLARQSQLILREYCNDAVLRERAKMWDAAAKELPQVSKDFLAATHRAKDAEWDKDDVGTQFLAKSAQTQKVIDDWEKRVSAAQPAQALERVAALIKPTYDKVQQAVQGYNNEVKSAAESGATGEQIRAIELKWRRIAGAAMNILGQAATESAQAMRQLVGAPEWRGVSDAAPATDTGPANPNNRTGTGPASPRNTEQSTAPQQQSPQTAPPGTPTTGTPTSGTPTAGNPTGGSPTGGGPTGSSDPALSGGLGSAPQIPTPTLPQLPGAGTPSIPGGGAPLIPPMIPPAGAANGIGIGGGGRPIGGGGIRVPGVSLGSGGSIPVAGSASATPANRMPTATGPTASALGSASGTAGAGSAMPPMMPPMGAAGAGAGLGGGGGTPGSGAAKRAAPGRGRARDGRTPGLVGPLSGKAGKADPNAFAARNRRDAEESDIPSTVQLIDEDLWQVEHRTPATRQ